MTRRKSERNKPKASPEKKTEKPTRKSTRRRGRRSPSTSSEHENAEEKSRNSPCGKESEIQSTTEIPSERIEPEENKNVTEETVTSSGKPSLPTEKNEEEESGFLWKVARADASPGEIQKLKLSRQRNTSEASSEASYSRKKSSSTTSGSGSINTGSGKWQECGEGVAGGEADSEVDEQLVSCTTTRTSSSSNEDPANDPSSSSHPGQDPSQEVSDSKEILSCETTTSSANLLSDNVDKRQRHDDDDDNDDFNEAVCSNNNQQNVDSTVKPTSTSTPPPATDTAASTNDPTTITTSTVIDASAATPPSTDDPPPTQTPDEESPEVTTQEPTLHDQNLLVEIEKNTEKDDDKSSVEEKTSSSFDALTIAKNLEPSKRGKEIESSEDEDDRNKNTVTDIGGSRTRSAPDSSSESNKEEEEEDDDDEEDPKDQRINRRTSSRASRRKHRNKYGDSSNSETPDSEDEHSVERKIKGKDKDSTIEKEKNKESEVSESSSPRSTTMTEKRPNFVSNNTEMEIDDNEIEIDDRKKLLMDSVVEKLDHPPSTVTANQTIPKPQKINLKRSFSSRISSDSNEAVNKKEEADNKMLNIESTDQNNKENHVNEQESKYVPRKRRWGIAPLSTDTTPTISISTDSLKALVPGAKPLSINEVRLSKDDDEDRRDRERDSKRQSSSDESIEKSKDDVTRNGTVKKTDGKLDNHIVTRRKISIVKDHHMKSPSPPASKPTNILLIKNLVRPFTLNQIKELLSRTGTIVENGFWMDRIKSKCFVEYSNEDQAFETRQALHGISWPLSNPKKLVVEYSTKEEMETARELSKDQAPLRKTEPLLDSWQQDWGREEKSNATKVTVVREWDLGKEEGQQHMKEKEREKKELDKKRRPRSRSPTREQHLPAPARKFKKKEDDPPPAKLLDDLFRKTKATPCIYWLPLTNEQIVVKEEMRRQHMAEHARRLEEMRRAERSRDNRRRRSPRK